MTVTPPPCAGQQPAEEGPGGLRNVYVIWLAKLRCYQNESQYRSTKQGKTRAGGTGPRAGKRHEWESGREAREDGSGERLSPPGWGAALLKWPPAASSARRRRRRRTAWLYRLAVRPRAVLAPTLANPGRPRPSGAPPKSKCCITQTNMDGIQHNPQRRDRVSHRREWARTAPAMVGGGSDQRTGGQPGTGPTTHLCSACGRSPCPGACGPKVRRCGHQGRPLRRPPWPRYPA